jgi:hypothetical protein
MLWSGYLLHCLGCHTLCIDDEIGLTLLGKSRCARNDNPPRLFTVKEFEILQEFMFNNRLARQFPQLVNFTCSFPNESVFNVMSLYRDKTIHYKHYDVLYEMGYLDWNENRLRKIKYEYKTKVREWKTRHRKRYNRAVLEKKTYQWQHEALAHIFPSNAHWFLPKSADPIMIPASEHDNIELIYLIEEAVMEN